MHEFTVARELVDVAIEEAGRAGAAHVTRVCCRIGPLRQIETALLREAFEFASAATICEGAELVIERTPLTVRCRACHEVFPAADEAWTCPRCRAGDAVLTGGDELELVSLEAQAEEREVRDDDRCASQRV